MGSSGAVCEYPHVTTNPPLVGDAWAGAIPTREVAASKTSTRIEGRMQAYAYHPLPVEFKALRRRGPRRIDRWRGSALGLAPRRRRGRPRRRSPALLGATPV